MFHKLLVMFALVFSFNAAYAKSKKSNKKANVAVLLKYDHAVYLKLGKKARGQYLAALVDLAVKIENQTGGKKTAWMIIEELLVPQANAVDPYCFNGGLAYRATAADCAAGIIPAGQLTGAAGNFACGANESPCNIAFGLTATTDGAARGFCYPRSQASSATSYCRNEAAKTGSDGKTGLQRLQTRLDACPSFNSTADCRALTGAITAHTETLQDYCTNAPRYRSTCESTRTQVAGIVAKANGSSAGVVDPASPDVSVPATAEGCTAVDHSVISQAVSNMSGGQGVDPKWMQLVSMTKGACGMGNNFKLMDQFKKFGMCYGSDRPGAMSTTLQQAMVKLQSGQRPDNADLGHFKDYFGMDFQEYLGLFCGSSSTLAFAEKIHNMGNRNTPSGSPDRPMVDWLLNQDTAKLNQFLTTVPANAATLPTGRGGAQENARVAFQRYITKKSAHETAQLQLRAAQGDLSREPNNVLFQSAVRTAQDAANAALSAMAGEKSGLAVSLAGSPGGTSAAANAPSRLRTWVGDSVYATTRSNFGEAQLRDSLNTGGMSADGAASRQKFMACAEQAVEVKDGATQFDSTTAKSNFNGCSQQTLSSRPSTVYSSGNLGPLSMQALPSNGGACFFSAGALVPKPECADKGGAALVYYEGGKDINARNELNVCVNDINTRFVVSNMRCAGNSNAAPPTANCPAGTELRQSSGGDWGCLDVAR